MTEKERKIRKLTARQTEILEFVIGFIEEHKHAPSITEVARAFDIHSKNGVVDHFTALVRKGYIHREINIARSITVLRDAKGNPFQN